MKQKEVPNKYEFLASFFLPNGMLDWFDIVKIEEEPNDGTKKFDGFSALYFTYILTSVTTVRVRHLALFQTALLSLLQSRIIRFVTAR